MHRLRSLATMLLLVAHATGILDAGEWTRFRGPNGSGVGRADGLPAETTADDVRWTAELPGRGNGSPVVWSEKLFVLAANENGSRRMVVCLDTTSGKELWVREFDAASHRKHRQNSYASSTPAVDAEHVYASWALPEKITLVALTHAGELVWERDLGPFPAGHGYAVSPIVHNGLVVIGNDQEGESSLFAFDLRTGETVWQTAREKSRRATYSTPCLYDPPGRDPELIFTNWQHGITAIDPADGSVNWELSVFDTSRAERAIGSPIVVDDLVIGTCGFTTAQKHVVAVRPGDGGVEEVYRIERSVPHVPTLLAHDGRLYLWSDKGVLACHDARTGDQLWQERVGGEYFGSPVCVNDRLYAVDSTGEIVVVATGEEFRELGRYALGDGCHSTPAVANDTLFVRTHGKLFAIGGK